jgi:Na+/H+ antiporter NhaD/arsenite permease-like protein
MPAHWTKSRRKFQINLPVSVDPSARVRDHFAMMAPPPVLILPFALLLGAMALAPIFAPQWWLRHYAKVALGLGAFTAGYYWLGLHDAHSLGEVAHEYLSFVALVGSLFVVAGGIHLSFKGEATPVVNVVFLLFGAVIANLLGTTGAAMLLIRPWIRLNYHRVTAHHIVFFIFIVANAGGCLTPIGDPPLFLGYLQGIPFWWVLEHCWPMWLLGVGLLLAIFYVVDRKNFLRAPREVREVREREIGHKSWHFDGLSNLFFLAVILGAVFVQKPSFLREGLMLAAAAGSYFTTKKSVHQANDFNFHPIQEVAILFAGIFATMIPALAWLNHGSASLLGEHPAPGIFYWGTGLLSSALDNAPTYLGFLTALHGTASAEDIHSLLVTHNHHVLAISTGAVFFGAATYIGNGPNFMVKAIAEQNGVRMPSFVEFVVKFSLPFLLPVLVTVWLLFFRG